MKRSPARGFTLIELMIVVAIIGILSTIAMPVFQKATLRTRASERIYMLKAIHTVIEDVYRQKDRFPPDPTVDTLTGEWNPVGPPGTSKRRFNHSLDEGWSILTGYGSSGINAGGSLFIEGETYYRYKYEAWESGVPGAHIWAEGDLDGDRNASQKTITLVRDRGTYLPAGEDPPPGQEDATTY